MATKIILNRKSEMINRAKGVKIFIDGAEVNKIANGSTEEYAVPPGTHTIQAKINWCSSPEFTVHLNENEIRILQLRSGMKYYTASYIIVLIVLFTPYILRLAHIDMPPAYRLISALLVLPFLLYLGYYLTFGKRKYLQIEEDKKSIFN